MLGPVRVAQLISVMIIIGAMGVFLFRFREHGINKNR